jgi:hypothetical protein
MVMLRSVALARVTSQCSWGHSYGSFAHLDFIPGMPARSIRLRSLHSAVDVPFDFPVKFLVHFVAGIFYREASLLVAASGTSPRPQPTGNPTLSARTFCFQAKDNLSTLSRKSTIPPPQVN